MKIKEFIVVEGKDDTTAVRNAVQADTIETGGSAINEETIRTIYHAMEKRGVIILTDPDFPGEKIRNEITKKVPNVKHAFIPRELAKSKRGKIGVEHASKETIREALKNAHVTMIDISNEITIQDLLDSGLIAGEGCCLKREKLGKLLRIGKTNGKQLLNRLNRFQISKEDFKKAVNQLIKEDQK